MDPMVRNTPVVLDLETQKLFSEVGAERHRALKVSVIGIYQYATDRYETFEEKEIHRLEPLLHQASSLIGFNIRDFDLPVLKPYLLRPIDTIPIFDLLEEIERVRGHRVSLESIAQATLQKGKSGTGLEAVQLFREGRMEELKAYCLDDVRITREIYEYGKTNGRISFLSQKDGRIHEIPVSWAAWTPETPQKSPFPSSLF